MPQFADRVKTTSTSTGSSAITLSSSGATGYQAFPSSLDGKTVGYVIEASGGTDWEIGTGVYTHSTLGLSRTLRSSSTGSLLNLSSGTHTVFLTPAFQDIQIVEAFSGTSDLPSASDNHGRIYHVHGEGAMYFAHSGSWVKLANYSDITTYTHPNHSGEVTSTGDGATVIADNVVDEANLKVSNSPTDGYVLTARSGNTGGMTWEAVSGGGGSAASALTETTFSASANQTAFVVSGGITNAANISVFQNGVKLEEGASKDYTASASTNTVTLNSGAAAGDVVEVLEYGQPASSGSGVTTYTAKSGTDGTPAGATYIDNVSSPSEGDLAYDLAADQLYIRTTSAWKRVSIGVDESPVITTEPATTHTLNSDGSTSTVTMVATDPEGFGITYGIAYPTTNNALPDQLETATSINQSTGVFTFDPSTTSSDAGTVKVRLSASDGISTTTRFVTLSLEFATWYGERGVFFGGTNASAATVTTIQYVSISTTSNAASFGDLTYAGGWGMGAVSNATYGVCHTFNTSHSSFKGLDYVTISTTSNAQAFGDLTTSEDRGASASNGVTGLFSSNSVMDQITIATTGNATASAASLSVSRDDHAGCANGNRAVFAGAYTASNIIDYVSWSSLGAGTDFGDLTVARGMLAGLSNETYGVYGGGTTGSSNNTIDYITIATTGNATDFGDLTSARMRLAASSNGTRGIFGGGNTTSASNTIDYITIATPSNATDFGDLTAALEKLSAVSGAAA